MRFCAGPADLPRGEERVGDAAAAADDRPGEGRGDLGSPPPAHDPGTATGRGESTVRPGRSGVAGRFAAPPPPRRAAPGATARATRDCAALAPRSACPTPCAHLASEASRPASKPYG